MKKNIFFILLVSLLNFTCIYSQDKEKESENLSAQAEEKKEEAAISSVCEVIPSEKDPSLFTIELKNADINDLFRLMAHDYSLNILVDEKVKGTVTASLSSISLDEALEVISGMNNLIIERKGNVLVVKPNLITRTFYLKYVNAEELIRQSKEVVSNESPSGDEVLTTKMISAGNTIYDLLSDNGKVFSGSQGNSLVVIDYPPQVKRIEEYLKAIDTRLCTRTFKLQYISIKDLFPDLIDQERAERKKQREERREERLEIKEIWEKAREDE